MRVVILALAIAATFALAASAQPPGGKPRPNGQSGSVCLAECKRAYDQCRAQGQSDGIPVYCTPRYQACVKTCK